MKIKKKKIEGGGWVGCGGGGMGGPGGVRSGIGLGEVGVARFGVGWMWGMGDVNKNKRH